eukprot:s1770_g5.t1
MEFSPLRRAGTTVAASDRAYERDAKAKELIGTLPTDSVMQYQLALRVELERQTKQLEELLRKQADTAFQQNLEHRQEVQGISEAWQLVARTLGEQLSSMHSLQKKNQETCKRLELSVSKLLEGEAEAMRAKLKEIVTEKIERFDSQFSILHQQSQRMEKSVLDLVEKAAPLPLKVNTLGSDHGLPVLPGQSEDDSRFNSEDISLRPSVRKERRRDRTLKVMRGSDPVGDEQSFADLQKQHPGKTYGIRQRIANPLEVRSSCCLRDVCNQIVAHKRFEMGCGILVILCALSIGVESDYTIQHALEPQHPVFRGLDLTFNLFFALELAVRWISEGFVHFLSCDNSSFKWNWMDLGLVSSSVVEEIAALMAAASFLEVSALRMLRMMRLVRVARIIRMLRFFSELRVMVNGIMGSAKPLLWAFVFLLILMFMVGVTFMQLAANYMSQDNIPADDALLLYWGLEFVMQCFWTAQNNGSKSSVHNPRMTLYMAISGGIDWKDCVQPLHVVSSIMEYMFATYVFFTLFCCLNIVTGIFVDNAKALKSADEDAMYLEAVTERKRWIAEVKDLFMRLDSSVNGTFTFEDFKVQVSNIKVQTLFRKLGINIDNIEAEELWEILDADHSGEIDEDFWTETHCLRDTLRVILLPSESEFTLLNWRVFSIRFKRSNAVVERHRASLFHPVQEEFAKGLKYFQGPAQSIHIYRLMKESAKLHDKVEDLQDVLAKATNSPAQRALHAIDSELEFGTQRLRRIRDHLCGNEDCLHSMTGSRDAASFMSSSAWRGAATVLVRQMLLEEVATKDLRHYLLQLQYLGFASRTKIWRKSLEHRAVMEIASEGSSGGHHRVIQSNLAPLLSVPLGPTNRKRLERTLQEMAQGFSLGHLSMQPDRGKTFAHQAALAFSDIFEKQQQKWQFRAYPIQSCIGAVSDLHSSMVEDGCFLRPSPWAEQLPWKPNLDEEFEEQRMLLDASYARRSTPLRVGALNHSLSTAHRSKPTYARQLLDQAAALLGPDPTMKGIVEVPGGGCASVDSLLGNELKTLQLADSTLAARRCNEKAEEPVGGPGAAEFATQNQTQDKMPQHLLRAYYLLRFLQSRSCRWRLLAVLNFFRFVQRRLAMASAVLTTELDEGKGSSFIGRESDPSQRVEEKAQDKYWDISSRGLSRILRHCSLPFTDDPPTAGDFDPLKLDRETYTSDNEDTFVIKDSFGRQVLHEAALNDLDCLELEMLKIGSYFIHKYEATRSDEREIAAVDRCAVLYDLLASEVWFNTEKQHLVEVYLNIFEDTTDPLEQRILAQRIIDVMALRPRLDLQEPYFVEAYSASILLLRSRSALLKELQQHQVSCEVSASKRATSKTAERSFGRSAGSSGGFNAAATPGSSLRSGQGMLMPGLDGGLAHPQEGNTLSGGVATARREGEIMCADGDKILGHNTCCLVWKAELILESVHKDLAQHFQTPPVASTQLERACYVVAMEKWSQQQEPFFQSELPPHEDPELHLTLLQELAKRLLGIEQQDRQRWRQGGPTFAGEEFGKAQAVPSTPVSKYSSWVESISMNDMMTHAFEEVASAASDPSLTLQASYQHALGCLLAQLVEFLEVRGRLQDTAVEVQHLQSVLKEQAMDFGSSLLPLKNISGEDANALRGNQLTAALVTKSMGSLQASTSDALLMHCSKQKLQEVRQMLQHELAFRCLALACVQQNALLLDPQVRSKELSDISTIGLSRDAVASDGGLGVMRRLRDSLEISGHDKNHPHAKQQPDQDVLASVSHNSSNEVSKMSGTEDKQGAAIMDMSRYAQYLQQPARYLEPVIAVLSRIWVEMDSMREHRLLRFKLLRCSSLMALRASCDLVTGLQVDQTSNELARMAMLLPKSLTPFTYGDRVKPLVERDGQVTNIFSLPNTFDSLQLRALPPREFGPLAEILADRAIEETEESTFEEELKEHLDLNINGPAIVALQVLNAVAQLFALRYAICMLEADPVCLLEAQRQSRFPSIDLEQLFRAHARSVQERSGDPVEQSTSKPVLSSEEEEIDTGDLSRAGPAYEAIEDLCADIARLVARLHALGPENSRKSTKVLEVLQTEIRSARRCLAVVLRRSTQRLQECGEANEAYALRQWGSLLEETELPPGDPPRPWFLELSPPTQGSLPAVERCSKESKNQIQESQEPCWNQQIHLHKVTIPAIARLHEDALSYISHLHPSLLDWRQELPDLVVALQSHFVGAAFPKKKRASPRIVRLPWQMPGAKCGSRKFIEDRQLGDV